MKGMLIGAAVVGVIGALIFIVAQLSTNGLVNAPWGGGTSTKAYSSDTYGVSFRYPDIYFPTERDVSAGYHTITLIEDTEENRALLRGEGPPREGPTSLSLEIFDVPEDTDLASWIQQTTEANFGLSPDGTLVPGELGGVPAYTYRWSGLYEGASAAVFHNGNVYIFSGTYLTFEDRIRADFLTLLESVKFTR